MYPDREGHSHHHRAISEDFLLSEPLFDLHAHSPKCGYLTVYFQIEKRRGSDL